MDIILKYFPELGKEKISQFKDLQSLYTNWNAKVNVISRKDLDYLYERHVLHSLALAKIFTPPAGSSFLDVGTGGGFPGIPLAILFPDSEFTLVDTIGKKIRIVQDISKNIGLSNVQAQQTQAQNVSGSYNYIVTRAVSKIDNIVDWTEGLLTKKQNSSMKNGIFSWKGGDLAEELKNHPRHQIYSINDWFEEDFFETKKIIYLPVK